MEIASMAVESKDDVKYICHEITELVKEQRQIDVWIRWSGGESIWWRVTDANRVCRDVGHQFKVWRHITVTITEGKDGEL